MCRNIRPERKKRVAKKKDDMERQTMRKGADMYQEMLVNSGTEEAEYSVRQQTLLIRFHSDIDHHNAAAIRTKADRLIARGGLKNIVFDFEDTSFMDSSGIGIIIGRYKKISCFGGKVYAIHADERIRKILKTSGMASIIEVLS